MISKIPFRREIPDFFFFFSQYLSKKAFRLLVFLAVLVVKTGEGLEEGKNLVVRTLLWRRGALVQPMVHAGMVGLTGFVLLGSSFWGSSLSFGNSPSEEHVLKSPVQIATTISEKPRDKIITYTVQRGDTLTSIAEKFAISIDTIRWANNLKNIHDIYPGDELKILPVSGVAHKVKKGDTIYSVAKKYDADPQAILDFPFNEIDENFGLKIGQLLIVPDGVMPNQSLWSPRVRFAAPIKPVVDGGKFVWPLHGAITQYPHWYHMAVDIAGKVGTPILASRNGKVVSTLASRWGYGYHVIVDHGDGTSTLYAHLSGFNVREGDWVRGGATVIGWVGLTGRTTGPHLHFEIRKHGIPQNPLNYLR